jgi:hypothetical protein
VKKKVLLIIAAAALLGVLVIVLPSPTRADAVQTFPTMRITTPESPFVERNLRQEGIINISGAPYGQNLHARVTVRGRGNSTWGYGEDKRPLRLRFDSPIPLFGSDTPHRDWILLANHFDPSQLRNYAALSFAHSLDNLHSINTFQFVHLYVNGRYMGLYLLTDERNTEPGRLDIRATSNPATSGFFIELDGHAPQVGTLDEDFIMVTMRPYSFREPSGNMLTPAHMEYASDFITRTSRAIRFGSWEEVTALIDVPSFIDMFIVQELFANPDAYHSSLFFYITGTGEDRRMYMGPPWDFDLSVANINYHERATQPEGLFIAHYHYWYRYFFTRDEFRAALASRWQEIRYAQIEDMLAHLRHVTDAHAACFSREWARHPSFTHPWPRPEIYEMGMNRAQQLFVLDWLTTRVDWLTEYLSN